MNDEYERSNHNVHRRSGNRSVVRHTGALYAHGICRNPNGVARPVLMRSVADVSGIGKLDGQALIGANACVMCASMRMNVLAHLLGLSSVQFCCKVLTVRRKLRQFTV